MPLGGRNNQYVVFSAILHQPLCTISVWGGVSGLAQSSGSHVMQSWLSKELHGRHYHLLSCQVMAWVNQYHDTLRDLGIEEEELGFPLSSDRGIGMLTDKYIDRMRQQLNAWCTNILQVSDHARPACMPAVSCCFHSQSSS